MKKVFGTLLEGIGLAAFCICLFFCTIFIYENYQVSDLVWFMRWFISGLLGLAGLAALWKGKKLYQADGESLTARKVSGGLMIFVGIVLVIVGIPVYLFYNYSYEWPYFATGMSYIVLGIVLAVSGALKFRAGRTPVVPKVNTPAVPSGMVCPECGKKYPLGKVYCEACGALLKETFSASAAPTRRVCPKCGMQYPLGQAYCGACGTKLQDA